MVKYPTIKMILQKVGHSIQLGCCATVEADLPGHTDDVVDLVNKALHRPKSHHAQMSLRTVMLQPQEAPLTSTRLRLIWRPRRPEHLHKLPDLALAHLCRGLPILKSAVIEIHREEAEECASAFR